MTITIIEALEIMRDDAQEKADDLTCRGFDNEILQTIADHHNRAIATIKARDAQQEKPE